MPRFFRAVRYDIKRYRMSFKPRRLFALRMAWRATNCTLWCFSAHQHPAVARDPRCHKLAADYMAILVTPKEYNALPWGGMTSATRADMFTGEGGPDRV